MFDWFRRYAGRNDPHFVYAMRLDAADRKLLVDCERHYKGNFAQMLGELALLIQHTSQTNQGIGELVDKMSRAELLHRYESRNGVRLINYLLEYDRKFRRSFDKTDTGIFKAASFL